MFQPFEKFKAAYIPRLISLNKNFLVSQTYKAGQNHFDETGKINILLSDYGDIGLAELHKKAVRQDKYAAIIDLKKKKHVDKLNELLAAESNYNLFWAVVASREEIKKRLDLKYKSNIRRFIEKNTNWRVGSSENIKTALEVTFGEFYLVIKRGNQTIRIKFEDIQTS